MKHLEMTQKLAVLHCVYQVIASADGSIDEERDYQAIDLALKELGLTSVYSWDSALRLSAHDCFAHVATLSATDKELFRALIHSIAQMAGNTLFRTNCANHILQLCEG